MPPVSRGHWERRAPGRAHPHRGDLGQGQELTWWGLGRSRWVRRGLRPGCALLPSGATGPGSGIPAATGPGSHSAEGHSPHPAVPPDRRRRGGHRTARTLLPPGAPSCAGQAPTQEHLGRCGLGAAGGYWGS